MTNLPINGMISILLLVGITAFVLFIQIKLSRSKNKYLGLILPIISFGYALLLVLGAAAFTFSTATTTTEIVSVIDEESGEELVEAEEIIESSEEVNVNSADFMGLSFLFVVSNVPTVILGGIYWSERNRRTMRKEIEKMKIDDL